MQTKLSIPEMQILIADRKLAFERNEALLFEKNQKLDSYKSQVYFFYILVLLFTLYYIRCTTIYK